MSFDYAAYLTSLEQLILEAESPTSVWVDKLVKSSLDPQTLRYYSAIFHDAVLASKWPLFVLNNKPTKDISSLQRSVECLVFKLIANVSRIPQSVSIPEIDNLYNHLSSLPISPNNKSIIQEWDAKTPGCGISLKFSLFHSLSLDASYSIQVQVPTALGALASVTRLLSNLSMTTGSFAGNSARAFSSCFFEAESKIENIKKYVKSDIVPEIKSEFDDILAITGRSSDFVKIVSKYAK